MLYMVMFREHDRSDRLCFKNDYNTPAIYEDRADAVRFMEQLQKKRPGTPYFVKHVTPVPATPRPSL